MKSNIIFFAVCVLFLGLIALSANGSSNLKRETNRQESSSSSSYYFITERLASFEASSASSSRNDYFVASNTAILLSTDISHISDTVFRVMVIDTARGVNNAFRSISGKNLCENKHFLKAAGSVVCSKPVIIVYDPICSPCDARILSKNDTLPNTDNTLSISYNGLSKQAMLSFVFKEGKKRPQIVINKKLMEEYRFFPDPSLKQE
jgi:hypothetical protein